MSNPQVSPFTDLSPSRVWHYFYALTQIPRPSFEEEAVQQFVLDEAARLGLWAERDSVGNVLVRKPATQGMEDTPGVILQNHLDMVAQKNEDSDHDFKSDPIEAYIDGEWVTAKGTTLGADNGIGASSALAILAADDIAHGPLEALFTATEETGMLGALGLKPDWLQGSILLNLDTEELGDICIGCAGGIDATFCLPLSWQVPVASSTYTLSVKGLKGGHSGIDIIKQRGNAALILVELLDSISNDIEIASIQSGDLRNAIPRESKAILTNKLSESQLNAQLDKVVEVIRRGLPPEDRDMTVTLEQTDMAEQVWTADTQKQLLTVLRLCPNGVDRMSVDAEGVVETSVNLAKIDTKDDALEIQSLLRSLDDARRDDLAYRMKRLFEKFGATVHLDNAYPGWLPKPGATITDTVIAAAQTVLGQAPNVTVIHAGLECGILGENYPHWQMLSFGPTIQMPHSPDERVHIQSVAKFWDWLLEVLKNIK